MAVRFLRSLADVRIQRLFPVSLMETVSLHLCVIGWDERGHVTSSLPGKVASEVWMEKKTGYFSHVIKSKNIAAIFECKQT